MSITSMARNKICLKTEVAYKYWLIHSFCNPLHTNIKRLDKSYHAELQSHFLLAHILKHLHGFLLQVLKQ